MKKLEVVAAIVWKNNQILSAQRGDSKYEYIKYRHEFPSIGECQNTKKSNCLQIDTFSS